PAYKLTNSLDSITNWAPTDPYTLFLIINTDLPPPLQKFNNSLKSKIINFVTRESFINIWTPRCQTANLSNTTGIKWQKTTPTKNPQSLPSSTTKPIQPSATLLNDILSECLTSNLNLPSLNHFVKNMH